MRFTFAMPWPDNTWFTSDAFKVGAQIRCRGLLGEMQTGRLVATEHQPDERRTLLTVEVEDSQADAI